MAQGKMMGRVFRKAAIGVAALAMVCAMAPMAMAADGGNGYADRDTQNDKTITVEWTAADGTECVADVDAAELADTENVYAAQYGTGSWSVIGTQNSVAVGDVIAAAECDGYEASEVWTEESKPDLTVITTDYPNGYATYTYSDMMDPLPFYSDTTSRTLGSDVAFSYAARIALTYTSKSISETASSTLAGMNLEGISSVTRLVFGYSANGVSGNRFPKEVCALRIN